MTVPALAVVETGRANLASVRAAFRRLGVDAVPVSDPDAMRKAWRLVLPGVGNFGDVMAGLAATGAAEAIRARVTAGEPFLAICLGMQLLARTSEEAPGIPGLGLLERPVRRLEAPAKVPQLGWNAVRGARPSGLVRDGYAYFANSFALTDAPAGWDASTAVHGGPFVAALERGPQLACQFHPELSGAWGAALLERWLAC
jgi:glutamine amidotransferase